VTRHAGWLADWRLEASLRRRPDTSLTVIFRPVLGPEKPANPIETGGVPHGDKATGVRRQQLALMYNQRLKMPGAIPLFLLTP